MIPILFLAVTLADLPGGDAARFDACTKLIKSSPAEALLQAQAWGMRSTDIPAQHCLGLAFVASERWEPAALVFETAAREAERRRDGRAATMWTQAGNAALAADDPSRARDFIDKALAMPNVPDQLKGEAWIDRGRADVALRDLPTARYDLDKAVKLVPADPFAWLLSATLARRQNDLVRAQSEIETAMKLAPEDAAVAVEAGNIAALAGKREAAKVAWAHAVEVAPDTPEGQAAAAALAQND